MSNKGKTEDAKLNEIKKLKDLLRNQIAEIKDLKNQLENVEANPDGSVVQSADISKLKKTIQDQKIKLDDKDSKMAALRKDLNSSRREVEAHLKRHSDEMIDLHNSLMKERMSRDYLLSNLTQEFVEVIKSSASAKPKKQADKNARAEAMDIKPNIEKILIPQHNRSMKEGRLNIFYASPITPNFDQSSGGKRAFRMLELLAEHHNVYCYSRRTTSQNHKDALEAIGVTVISNLNPHHIVERIGNIDVIIAAWYYIYFDIEPIIKRFSHAKLIVDSVDIHWVREERSLGKWDGITEEKQIENKEKEIEVYQNADIIWVVTEEDAMAVRTEIPHSDVRVVSNIHSMKKDTFKKDKPNNILFFGGYNHYPNINAAKILAKKIFPQIKEEVKDATLIIAGSNAPEEISELGSLDGVEFRGFIDYADIKDLYQNSKVTIVPLTEGAGIKGKICEAIEYRTAVVTNDIGNEGIDLETGVDGFATNDYNEMADFTIDILNDKYDLEEITLRAQEKVESLLGPEANYNVMFNSFQPTVDICIVTYNNKEILEKCVQSIFDKTQYPYYNIIVYSNGCTDGTKEYLEELETKHHNVTSILSEKNEVFVRPNNHMMHMNPSHDVILLNNDIIVTEDWLNALVHEAYKSNRIGIVGSKILYPDNTLQEFGSGLFSSGSGNNIGKNDDPNKAEYMRPKKASYVSGCSMFIKRSTIKKIGVFDELFHPCYAEDSDYCYSAWQRNIEVNVTPNSVVYHFEGGSSGNDENTGFKKFQTINIQKFLGKHGKAVDRINELVEKINSEYPTLD